MASLRRSVALLAASALALPAPAAAAPVVGDLRFEPAEFVAYGSSSQDRLGLSLDIGDLNGDGIADIASGAPLAEKPNDATFNRGALHVYFGRPGLSGERDASKAGSPDLVVYGQKGGPDDGANIKSDVLGKGVAIGDVTGDGRNDLVVSALRANARKRTRAGKVYVFFGKSNDPWPSVIDLSKNPGKPDVTILGDRANGDFGIHLAVGDVDGDGRGDIVIGAAATLSKKQRGFLRVVYGKKAKNMPAVVDMRSPTGVRTFKVTGERVGDKLGHGVAVGDLNGDGIDDLVAGAPRGGGECTASSTGRGKAFVFFGSAAKPPRGVHRLATTPADVKVVVPERNDQLGRRVAVGEVSGDSTEDLILGARCADGPGGGRKDAGAGHVLFGPLTKGVRRLAKAPAEATVHGRAGHSLGVGPGAGDVNGDGRGDLVLGAEGGSGPAGDRTNAGAVFVLFGPIGRGIRALASAPADLAAHGPDRNDRLGRFVATGDVDGDGVADLGVSAYLANGPGNATGPQTGEVHVLTTVGR